MSGRRSPRSTCVGRRSTTRCSSTAPPSTTSTPSTCAPRPGSPPSTRAAARSSCDDGARLALRATPDRDRCLAAPARGPRERPARGALPAHARRCRRHPRSGRCGSSGRGDRRRLDRRRGLGVAAAARAVGGDGRARLGAPGAGARPRGWRGLPGPARRSMASDSIWASASPRSGASARWRRSRPPTARASRPTWSSWGSGPAHGRELAADAGLDGRRRHRGRRTPRDECAGRLRGR